MGPRFVIKRLEFVRIDDITFFNMKYIEKISFGSWLKFLLELNNVLKNNRNEGRKC